MKNTLIKNLYQEVPANIRLGVYKESLKHLREDREYRKFPYSGLCLVLPMILWGLEAAGRCAPDGKDWNHEDTVIAFPELSEEIINEIEKCFHNTRKDSLRIKYLEKWINDLEKTL